ncbi:N-acetyltransferase [Actinomadura logoneensis]|uniref:N-acetyltransferase n=1 Tax=Actinomadura logoneensis TaxID=2293572 RepID=A0A372JIS5_9ACTN|nr:GNAT family N-acetyltransferase [Actinomadura logoneensis]RFU39915.1 N-acetyltransferase [Actinomadura logoneensis]
MRSLDQRLGDGDLRLRTLDAADAALVVEATSGEPGRSLWGPHLGPYSADDARAAMADWDPAAGGQFSLGIVHGGRLLGAVGLIPENPGSMELAYWLRPGERGKGIASQAVLAASAWTYEELGVPRVWLEIYPDNEPSLRLAERIGYRFEAHVPRHCRDWAHEDPARDTWHDCVIWVYPGTPAPRTPLSV